MEGPKPFAVLLDPEARGIYRRWSLLTATGCIGVCLVGDQHCVLIDPIYFHVTQRIAFHLAGVLGHEIDGFVLALGYAAGIDHHSVVCEVLFEWPHNFVLPRFPQLLFGGRKLLLHIRVLALRCLRKSEHPTHQQSNSHNYKLPAVMSLLVWVLVGVPPLRCWRCQLIAVSIDIRTTAAGRTLHSHRRDAACRVLYRADRACAFLINQLTLPFVPRAIDRFALPEDPTAGFLHSAFRRGRCGYQISAPTPSWHARGVR